MGARPKLFSLYSAFPTVYPSPQGVCSGDVVGQAPRTSKSEKCLIRKAVKTYFFYIYFWLGLPCCAQGFSSCGEKGLLLVGELGLLIREASPAAEHGL